MKKKREIKIYEEKYSGEIDWDNWLAERKIFLRKLEEAIEEDYGLSPLTDWESNEKRLFTMSQITKSFKDSQPDKFKFLGFINDIWYRELSLYSHSEPIAIFKMQHMLNNPNETHIQNFQNNQIWLCLVFLLSLATEIELSLNYNLKQKLDYIWIRFIDSSSSAKEIYEMRYKELLSN